MMSCKKCNSPKTVTLRKKDNYCDDCFMTSTNHKFRACIGKNKILSPNEKVLICLSGGIGSTVLLDLIQYGISLENTKKLRIVPFYLHLFDDSGEVTSESIMEQCKKLNFNLHLVHLAEYLNPDHKLKEPNCIPHVQHDDVIKFQTMLNSMPPTATTDFLLKVKRTLFIRYAKQLHCNFVFTAETTSTLAINLLCNIAVGRGSQVQNDIGFADFRDDKVKIIRPMKDISKEELDYYVTIKHIQPVCKSTNNTNSLQSVISSFVSDLQENFQSTISTVCKTADKIGVYREDSTQGKCLLCESDFNTKILKITALEATSISRTVSHGKNQHNNSDELAKILDTDSHTAVFPFVDKYLCYGCSRNHSEMSQSTYLPYHLPQQ